MHRNVGNDHFFPGDDVVRPLCSPCGPSAADRARTDAEDAAMGLASEFTAAATERADAMAIDAEYHTGCTTWEGWSGSDYCGHIQHFAGRGGHHHCRYLCWECTVTSIRWQRLL